jgi:hypothetical protein
LLARGISQVRGAAEIRGIGLDQICVELMLADQKAEAITEAWIAVLVTIDV